MRLCQQAVCNILCKNLCMLTAHIFAVASTSAAPQQLQTKAPYTIKAANGVFDMTAASKKQVWKVG